MRRWSMTYALRASSSRSGESTFESIVVALAMVLMALYIGGYI